MVNLNGRKARMLLVYPDYTDRDVKGKVSGGNYSEGLASISAVLKQGGHQVELLHLLYLHEEAEFKEKLREKGKFDVIGFSIRTTAFPDAQLYIRWTREVWPDVFIICGSYHCTLVPGEVLAVPEVDCVCIGDGEYAELELCDKMSAGEDYTSIESLWFKNEDGSFIKNPVRPLFADLDRIPIPDFDLFDYDNLESSKVNTAIVMMSRGCFFNCTYCGNSQFRNVYPNKKIYARFRSPQNGILYLKTLLEKHPNIKFINFRDAIFNMFPAWFDEFIELYKQEIHLPFTGNIRFDILTEDTVRRMKEAGCYTIDMGLESGDPEMRFKYLKRNMTDEMIINCSRWFHKYGISQLTRSRPSSSTRASSPTAPSPTSSTRIPAPSSTTSPRRPATCRTSSRPTAACRSSRSSSPSTRCCSSRRTLCTSSSATSGRLRCRAGWAGPTNAFWISA